MQGNPPADPTTNILNGVWGETIEFEEDPSLWITPSVNCAVHEEMLQEEQQPFILWASLKLNIPLNPNNASNAVFKGLANFIDAATEEYKQFMVFPHNLSNYNLVEDLPPVVNDVESLPEEVEDWFHYFPQAKPCSQGGGIYMAILIGLSMPIPKFIKTQPMV